MGDVTTERRLKNLAEREFGPNFFNDEDRFAWRFGLDEQHPRSQLNGLLILSEIGQPGAWSNVYKGNNLDHFDQPTVIGVDFPKLGISRAINDSDSSKLYVSTYAATKSAANQKTSWKVCNLDHAQSVSVYLENNPYPDWTVIDSNTIEINTTIESKNFCIAYKPKLFGTKSTNSVGARSSMSATSPQVAGKQIRTVYKPASPPSCSCC